MGGHIYREISEKFNEWAQQYDWGAHFQFMYSVVDAFVDGNDWFVDLVYASNKSMGAERYTIASSDGSGNVYANKACLDFLSKMRSAQEVANELRPPQREDNPLNWEVAIPGYWRCTRGYESAGPIEQLLYNEWLDVCQMISDHGPVREDAHRAVVNLREGQSVRMLNRTGHTLTVTKIPSCQRVLGSTKIVNGERVGRKIIVEEIARGISPAPDRPVVACQGDWGDE